MRKEILNLFFATAFIQSLSLIANVPDVPEPYTPPPTDQEVWEEVDQGQPTPTIVGKSSLPKPYTSLSTDQEVGEEVDQEEPIPTIIAEESPLPEPYASLRDLPADDYVFEDGDEVQALALSAAEVPIVIDVGSEKGSCTRFLAHALPEGRKIYSIETWNDDPSNTATLYAYHKFLNNLKQDGSAQVVVPIRMSSLEAAHALNVTADLIYLYSAHQKEVHASILAWFPHLSTEGIICGNNWTWHEVKVGVLDAAFDLNLHLHFDDNLWWLTKN